MSIPACRQRPVRSQGPTRVFTLGLSTGLLDQVLITGTTASGFPRLCERAKRVRLHVALNEAIKLGGRIQVVYGLRYEVEGEDKPCAVAELVFRHYD